MIYDLPHTFVIALFLGLLALAAINDIAEFKIPNRICLGIAALYPVHVLASPVTVDWLGGLAVGGIALVCGIVLFVLRAMGGGDIKLITVTALWAGPGAIVDFIGFSALAGGLMAIFMLSPVRFSLAMVFDRAGDKESRDALLGSVLPYGVAIAIGGFVVGAYLLGNGSPG